MPLCQKLTEAGYGKEFRIWAYSRVDTVTHPETLKLVRGAGIKWLALGIESASKNVRLEVSKGKFQDVDIKRVVEQIHQADIEVMANYIFGLPGDTLESMENTLSLSKELCTSGWNGYPAINLPGSQLYYNAIKNGIPVPDSYIGYSFHSYETVCNQTSELSAAQVLAFRDRAYAEYHQYPPFLERIKNRYGQTPVDNINKMTRVKLKRKLLES